MGVEMASALGDIAHERNRHRVEFGFTNDRDDTYITGQLAASAAFYAYSTTITNAQDTYTRLAMIEHDNGTLLFNVLRSLWPQAWKPPTWHDRRQQLVKAGAMIVAEIERIDRLAAKGLDANLRPLQPRREPE